MLFKGDVAAPMADFDLAIELGDVDDGFGKLESDLGGRNCASGLLVKRSVRQLGALLLWKLVDFGVVGDGGRGRLDFGLLLARLVSRRGKDGKVVDQILRLVLLNRSGKRAVRVEVKEGDAEGLLSAGLERVGEANPVVLGIAMRNFVLACKSPTGSRGREVASYLLGSYSTTSTANGPALSSLRSFTSKPPMRATCEEVNGM